MSHSQPRREALFFQVPMAVVPIFGDQPQNADVIARAGCGVSFRRPLESFTVPKLREVRRSMSTAPFLRWMSMDLA